MRASRLTTFGIALVAAAVLGACASGGSSVLSSTDLTAEDLATADYETVYDFLRAHNRARIVRYQGGEALAVYTRGGNIQSGQVSPGDAEVNPGFGEAGGSPVAQISGTGPSEGGGEALLIVNEREVTGNVTQIIRQMPLSSVQSLKILRPSETSARYGGDGRVGAVVIVTKSAGSGSGSGS